MCSYTGLNFNFQKSTVYSVNGFSLQLICTMTTCSVLMLHLNATWNQQSVLHHFWKSLKCHILIENQSTMNKAGDSIWLSWYFDIFLFYLICKYFSILFFKKKKKRITWFYTSPSLPMLFSIHIVLMLYTKKQVNFVM